MTHNDVCKAAPYKANKKLRVVHSTLSCGNHVTLRRSD